MADHHNNINIKNRRATFDYEIIETFTAGIVLTGTVSNLHIVPQPFFIFCIAPLTLIWSFKS